MNPSQTRWAFFLPDWKPTLQHMTMVSRCVQPEERLRISKFHFQRDAKASLVGRLLMRKYCSEVSGLGYDQLRLIRDSNNKPVLEVSENENPLYFNVSHQGNYVVLAGSSLANVGVDVMQVEQRKDTQEFFRLMRRQFSTNEWSKIRSYNSDFMQLKSFIRHWALKESYVKAVGTGLTFELDRIDFITKSELASETLTDTKVKIDSVLQQEWSFEETMLNYDHIAAVAYNSPTAVSKEESQFQLISYEDLVSGAIPFAENDPKFCEDFLSKPFSPKNP